MTIKKMILRKLNAVSKEDHDRTCAKLGAIIENHMDDEFWLMRCIGIEDHYKFRNSCSINREKIKLYLSNKDACSITEFKS